MSLHKTKRKDPVVVMLFGGNHLNNDNGWQDPHQLSLQALKELFGSSHCCKMHFPGTSDVNAEVCQNNSLEMLHLNRPMNIHPIDVLDYNLGIIMQFQAGQVLFLKRASMATRDHSRSELSEAAIAGIRQLVSACGLVTKGGIIAWG
eukprot:1143913-Pelagomonas_calceolata.AAC.3